MPLLFRRAAEDAQQLGAAARRLVAVVDVFGGPKRAFLGLGPLDETALEANALLGGHAPTSWCFLGQEELLALGVWRRWRCRRAAPGARRGRRASPCASARDELFGARGPCASSLPLSRSAASARSANAVEDGRIKTLSGARERGVGVVERWESSRRGRESVPRAKGPPRRLPRRAGCPADRGGAGRGADHWFGSSAKEVPHILKPRHEDIVSGPRTYTARSASGTARPARALLGRRT
jgi:hypothetical protein